MKPAIHIQPHGGIGNQLFQYAVGRHLALRNQSALLVDRSWFQPGLGREFGLGQFESVYGDDPTRVPSRVRRSTWRLAMKAPRACNTFLPHTYVDCGEAFDKQIFCQLPGVRLIGYFQSWRYFWDIRNELAAEISSLRSPSPQFMHLSARLNDGRPRAAVHVRRGDFLRAGHATYHSIVPISYYAEALNRIPIEPDWIIEFHSDDPQLVNDLREKAGLPNEFVNMEDFTQILPIERIWLMAQTDAIIGANSSMSLWAAYLSAAPGRNIVFPLSWYTHRTIVPSDRFLPDWQLI